MVILIIDEKNLYTLIKDKINKVKDIMKKWKYNIFSKQKNG